MIMRERATALLDAIGHGTERDLCKPHMARASAFLRCFLPDGQRRGAWRLVSMLHDAVAPGDPRKSIRAAADLAKLSHVPVDGLSWAWADPGSGPGCLDVRPQRGGRDEQAALGATTSWWSTSGRGILLLSGETGCGKTVAAAFAAVHYGGRFIRAAELGELALGAASALKALARVPLLVVDELGRENDLRTTGPRITELLGDRADQRLGTVVTAQLKRVDKNNPTLSFADRYGHHLLDRIERAGKWVSLSQPSRRNAARPVLDGITRSCRIAELLPKVEAATGAAGGRLEDVEEMQRLLGISDDDLHAAATTRESWRRPMLEEATAVGGVAGEVLRSMLAGEPMPERRRTEVVGG